MFALPESTNCTTEDAISQKMPRTNLEYDERKINIVLSHTWLLPFLSVQQIWLSKPLSNTRVAERRNTKAIAETCRCSCLCQGGYELKRRLSRSKTVQELWVNMNRF